MHSDVIHMFFKPLYLFPSWTSPRDFCLLRYWRLDDDGSYVVCYDSVEHPDCPVQDSHVRGELHAVYTIAPRKYDMVSSPSLVGGSQTGEKGGPQGIAQITSDGTPILSNESKSAPEAQPATPLSVDSSQQVIYSTPSHVTPHPNTQLSECLLTYIVQVDPKGWVPTYSPRKTQSYAEAFGIESLNHILDVRDNLDNERFVNVGLDGRGQFTGHHTSSQVSFDDIVGSDKTSEVYTGERLSFSDTENDKEDDHLVLKASNTSQDSQDRRMALVIGDSAEDGHEYGKKDSDSGGNDDLTSPAPQTASSPKPRRSSKKVTINNKPPPTNSKYWAEPSPINFNVRGKNYKTDKKKINAGKQALFRLICLEIIETDKPMMKGICGHPTERVQQALQREKDGEAGAMPPYVIAINIALPGPPFYHAVMYYAVDDMSKIDGSDGTPFSKLAQPFFFGDSDEFRDKTFKLIPQICEGNFIVRRAVGSTPAILGMKLKQTYRRGPRFFELICDVGSSSVAAGVVRLSIGYARTLVVDLAFVLQGNDPSTLPEQVFGTARMKHLNFDHPKFRFVKNY